MDEHESLFIAPSLSTVNNKAVSYQVISFSDIPITLSIDLHRANFRALTQTNINTSNQLIQQPLTIMTHQHIENTDLYLNQLMKTNQSSHEQ